MNLARRRGSEARRTIAGAFDPSTITGWHLLGWASNPAQTPAADALVATWEDMTANNRDLANIFGDGYSPRYRAAVAALGGKPALQFDGGDFLSVGFSALTQPYSVAVIGALTGWVNGSVMGLAGGVVDGARSDIFAYNDNKWYGFAGSSLGAPSPAVNANGHLWILDVNGGSSTLRLDGVAVATGAIGSQVLSGLIVGSLFSLNFPMSGHLAMVGIKASGLLTSAERNALLAGSQAFYGTP